ncbi:DegV family protein [Paenibacillus koleovorans]|uniref:DegV family protein n=1 Tax=Paenibacillus koleovorans TaxID=121608 RepID=UPI000FD6E19B|nr:DegV family protein [Paenibacillus koleovorans]
MANIRIVTDSTADIPESVRKEYGIEMVPLKVHIGTETYYDAVTIQSEQFYAKLAEASKLPTTSQPSPVDFLEAFKAAAVEPGDEVLAILLSSALSGTYQSAVLAKSLLDNELQVTVLDSKSASYGYGMLVVEAAKAVRAGKSLDEVVRLVQKMREKTRIYFLVDTLEYLQKGGRIGKASAVIGSLLNIKPILTIDPEGQVAPVDKVRGQKKALGRIVELLTEEFGQQEVVVTVAHANTPEAAQEFADLLGQHFNVSSTSFTTVGPVIGTHAGPGVLAVFMIPASVG